MLFDGVRLYGGSSEREPLPRCDRLHLLWFLPARASAASSRSITIPWPYFVYYDTVGTGAFRAVLKDSLLYLLWLRERPSFLKDLKVWWMFSQIFEELEIFFWNTGLHIRENLTVDFFLKNVKNYLTFFKMLVDTWRLLGISKYNVLEFLLILLNSPWNIFLSSFSDSLELIQNLWNFSRLLRYISAIWWYYSVLLKFLCCLNRTFWGFQRWYFYFLNELFKILNVYIVLENSIS